MDFQRTFVKLIEKKDLESLDAGALINDMVVNRYLDIIAERSTRDGRFKKVIPLPSQFFDSLDLNLVSAAYWPNKFDIFDANLVLFPVFSGNRTSGHWTLISVDFVKKTITHFDSKHSKHGSNIPLMKKVLTFLQYEAIQKKKKFYNGGYQLIEGHSPKQVNDVDCGAFVCQTAEFISRDQPSVCPRAHPNVQRNNAL